MRTSIKVSFLVVGCVAALMLGIGVGSVAYSPRVVAAVLGNQLFGIALPDGIAETAVSILWRIRVPRALLAFVVGAALSVSGLVMQSVLKNPLASSYTMGVSSGASLGAGIIMVTGFTLPLLRAFTLPFVGLVFGMATVVLAVAFAARMDRTMQNQTIILSGMVFSLFINAALTLLAALSRGQMERMLRWQMGSFALKEWSHLMMLAPMVLLGILALSCFTREMDILTFGEEQAMAMGVSRKSVKWALLCISAAMTGGAIAFAGVIGFVDLIVPHAVRRMFGSRHRITLPMSALMGGGLMVLADLVARTVISPSEMPVGAVTALIGAPFFVYVYFHRQRGK